MSTAEYSVGRASKIKLPDRPTKPQAQLLDETNPVALDRFLSSLAAKNGKSFSRRPRMTVQPFPAPLGRTAGYTTFRSITIIGARCFGG